MFFLHHASSMARGRGISVWRSVSQSTTSAQTDKVLDRLPWQTCMVLRGWIPLPLVKSWLFLQCHHNAAICGFEWKVSTSIGLADINSVDVYIIASQPFGLSCDASVTLCQKWCSLLRCLWRGKTLCISQEKKGCKIEIEPQSIKVQFPIFKDLLCVNCVANCYSLSLCCHLANHC